MEDLNVTDFNLDFLDSFHVQPRAQELKIVKCDSPVQPKKTYLKDPQQRFLSRKDLAQRVFQADVLVRKVHELEDERRKLLQKIEDLVSSADEIKKLYLQETQSRNALFDEKNELQAKCKALEEDLTHKSFLYDQMEAQNHDKPVDFDVLAVKYVAVMQKLILESSQTPADDLQTYEGVKSYCKDKRLRLPSITKKKSQIKKRSAHSEVAVQCDIWDKRDSPAKPNTREESVQCGTAVETRAIGTQHISCTTTRSTSTACFIQTHNVGTMFPEAAPLPAFEDMFNELAKWDIMQPVSPFPIESILEETRNTNTQATAPQSNCKSVGVCTDICNIQRQVDFYPQFSAVKVSNSRPPSRQMYTHEHIKHEIQTPISTPTLDTVLNAKPPNFSDNSALTNFNPLAIEFCLAFVVGRIVCGLLVHGDQILNAPKQVVPIPQECYNLQISSEHQETSCTKPSDNSEHSSFITDSSNCGVSNNGSDFQPIKHQKAALKANQMNFDCYESLKRIKLHPKSIATQQNYQKPVRRKSTKSNTKNKHARCKIEVQPKINSNEENGVDFILGLHKNLNHEASQEPREKVQTAAGTPDINICNKESISSQVEEHKANSDEIFEISEPNELNSSKNSTSTELDLSLTTWLSHSAVEDLLADPTTSIMSDLFANDKISSDLEQTNSTCTSNASKASKKQGRKRKSESETPHICKRSARLQAKHQIHSSDAPKSVVQIQQTTSVEVSNIDRKELRKSKQDTDENKSVLDYSPIKIALRNKLKNSQSRPNCQKVDVQEYRNTKQPRLTRGRNSNTLASMTNECTQQSQTSSQKDNQPLLSAMTTPSEATPNFTPNTIESDSVRLKDVAGNGFERVYQPTNEFSVIPQCDKMVFTSSTSQIVSNNVNDAQNLESQQKCRGQDGLSSKPSVVEVNLAASIPNPSELNTEAPMTLFENEEPTHFKINHLMHHNDSKGNNRGTLDTEHGLHLPCHSPCSPESMERTKDTYKPISTQFSLSATTMYESPASPKPNPVEDFTTPPKIIPCELQDHNLELKSRSILRALTNHSLNRQIKGKQFMKTEAAKLEHDIQNLQKQINLYLLKNEGDAFMECVTLVADLQRITSNIELIATAIVREIKIVPRVMCAAEATDGPLSLGACHQRISHVIRFLQYRYHSFYKDIIAKIEQMLFNCNKPLSQLDEVLNLTQLYLLTVLNEQCRLKNNPARLFIAKCFYFYKKISYPLIYEVLCWFPTALPHREDRSYNRSDALISVIQHLLMCTVYDMDKNELRSKELLSKLRYEYHYEPFKPNYVDILTNLVEKIKTGKLTNVQYAFALLCKRWPIARVITDVLQGQLLPLANEYYTFVQQSTEYDERVAALLDCISVIVKPQPMETDISPYLALFARFLNATRRPVVQEAAVLAILRLQRFGFANCFKSLITFEPDYELSSTTKAALATFAHRKPPTFWKSLKNELMF